MVDQHRNRVDHQILMDASPSRASPAMRVNRAHGAQGDGGMSPLDAEVQDEDTVDEIRMVTELMVVASMASGDLEQAVIDDALGVEAAPSPFPSQRLS